VRIPAGALPLCLLASVYLGAIPGFRLPAAEPGGRAEYVGGTLASFRSRTSGRIITTDPGMFLFASKSSSVQIPYENVSLLEYGQRVGRRYALAILISPVLLLSKSRRHFLTVSYLDEDGRRQAMVFQVHKEDVRSVLASLSARTGLKIEYQDDEARKTGGGG
jgi:hypothetical protein